MSLRPKTTRDNQSYQIAYVDWENNENLAQFSRFYINPKPSRNRYDTKICTENLKQKKKKIRKMENFHESWNLPADGDNATRRRLKSVDETAGRPSTAFIRGNAWRLRRYWAYKIGPCRSELITKEGLFVEVNNSAQTKHEHEKYNLGLSCGIC